MTLRSFLDRYSRIQLASSKNQEAIFSIIEKTSITSDALQVSFDRSPNFYAFLQAQGEKAFIFTFHNADGEAHGFACLSFRRMKFANHSIVLGYASDLRTQTTLDREARLQWRKMYGELIANIHQIKEFEGCIGIVTAVWSENKLAQKALVSKKRANDFSYVRTHDYSSCTIWGRWNLFSAIPKNIRPIRKEEVPLLKEKLFSENGLAWQEADLNHSLHVFKKSLLDFYVLEKDQDVQAFILPALSAESRKILIKKWPKQLERITKILPRLGRKPIFLNSPLDVLQLMLFKSLHGDADKNLIQFIRYFWLTNNKQPAENQFSLLNVNSWNPEFQKVLSENGFLCTPIRGSLYKVETEKSLEEFKNMHDFSNLEISFL